MGFSRGLAAEVGRQRRHGELHLAREHEARPGARICSNRIPSVERQQLRAYPVGRLGRVGDPAPLAVLLCSDAGEWITGQVYPVNGGYTSAL